MACNSQGKRLGCLKLNNQINLWGTVKYGYFKINAAPLQASSGYLKPLLQVAPPLIIATTSCCMAISAISSVPTVVIQNYWAVHEKPLALSALCMIALFLIYSMSFLVTHHLPKIRELSQSVFNPNRKLCLICLVVSSAAHLGCAVHAFTQGATCEPVSVVAYISGYVSLSILASIDLTMRQISKAVNLQLDIQGPSAAHSVMVVGAQEASRNLLILWVLLGSTWQSGRATANQDFIMALVWLSCIVTTAYIARLLSDS